MATVKVVPASEVKMGEVLHPFEDSIKDFRVDSIEKIVDNGKDFLIFRGASINTKNDVFKCYPTRMVGVSEGRSTIESINLIKRVNHFYTTITF